MKKLILLLIIILPLSAICSYAQESAKSTPKQETKQPEKPVYSPDLTSKHDVILKGISIEQLNDWVIYSTNKPEDITNSDKISSKTATRIINNYLLTGSQLKNQIDTLLAKDKLKWQADTAKKSTKSK